MIRWAVEEDIDQIMPYLTEEDLARFHRMRLNPRNVLKGSLGRYTYCGVVNGQVACMFGIKFAENIGEFPTLWLIKTPLIRDHQFEFLRENRKFVKWAVKEFGALESCVAKTNAVSWNWLFWLGFRPVEDLGGFVRMRVDA